MYFLTVFGKGNEREEIRRKRLLKVISFIKKENKRARYIFFSEESGADFVCGHILISEPQDICKLMRAGHRVFECEIGMESLQRLVRYIDIKANGKYGASENISGPTRFLSFPNKNSLRLYREMRRRLKR